MFPAVSFKTTQQNRPLVLPLCYDYHNPAAHSSHYFFMMLQLRVTNLETAPISVQLDIDQLEMYTSR